MGPRFDAVSVSGGTGETGVTSDDYSTLVSGGTDEPN